MPSSPKPTTVLFIRHGKTATTGKVLPGRAPGLHLSEVGLAAAEEVGEAVGKLPKVAAVYSSPMERTRETAAPIAKAAGMKVSVDKNLLEVDPGDWTGKSLTVLRKKPEWRVLQFAPSQFRFPNGESMMEMSARMNAFVETVRAKHPGGVVVAVSHGDPINMVMSDALGVPMDLMQRIQIAPTSVSIVTYTTERPIVLGVNLKAADVLDRMEP